MRRSGLSILCYLSVFLWSGCAASSNKIPPPAVSVAVAPPTASVGVGKTQQFTATVTGTSNTAVTWNVIGGSSNGTVTNSGLYTAPATVPNPPQVSVTATSQADTSKSTPAVVTVKTVSPSPLVAVMQGC